MLFLWWLSKRNKEYHAISTKGYFPVFQWEKDVLHCTVFPLYALVALTEVMRKNASIDWTIKESVKAKLKVIVKRTLKHFGYPPDTQKLATDLVLRQAEMLAGEFAGD